MRSSLFGKLRPQLPDDMHPGLVDLIHRCWHQDPDHRPSSAKVVVEIKRLVDSFGCIDPNIATVFGLDEGCISTLSTLEEDLNYSQNLLEANNEGSHSAEGFACGCEHVSGVGKFLQRFGLGNVDESVGNVSVWWELIDSASTKGDEFISLHHIRLGEATLLAMFGGSECLIS